MVDDTVVSMPTKVRTCTFVELPSGATIARCDDHTMWRAELQEAP